MQKTIILISAVVFFSIGCGGLTSISQTTPAPFVEPTWTFRPLPLPTGTVTGQPTVQLAATFTPLPSETPAPTLTFTATMTPEPQWVMQGPNEVIVPILLYHHIGFSPGNSPYYVPTYGFEQQMYLLQEWGYQTISVQLMVRAIKEGALLPPKPIILTFDDGSETVSTTALPIMQKYGFTGTAYIVYNYIGVNLYMDEAQIRGLYDAGWEIGSHTISHVDLTERTDRQQDEIVDSRRKLQNRLNVSILSFAYPFGAYDSDALHFVHFAGYIGAMGLGNKTLQSNKNLFYLYRMDIKSTDDLYSFALRLPWREDMNDLPIVTIIP